MPQNLSINWSTCQWLSQNGVVNQVSLGAWSWFNGTGSVFGEDRPMVGDEGLALTKGGLQSAMAGVSL